eukprot:NODE_582_length_5738_cov_0.811314.p5 type:complete len:213 gc:universal NODE_582_length_5738_cov_0.811314:2543-3181(+)
MMFYLFITLLYSIQCKKMAKQDAAPPAAIPDQPVAQPAVPPEVPAAPVAPAPPVAPVAPSPPPAAPAAPVTPPVAPAAPVATTNTTGAGGQTAGTGEKFTGDSTTYGASGTGACGTDTTTPAFSVALNQPQFGGNFKSEKCGQQLCVCGTGNKGSQGNAPKSYTCQTATVNNLCPECKQGALDLSQPLWKAVFPQDDPSRFEVSWTWGACKK